MTLDDLLERDLDYPEYMDWNAVCDDGKNIIYTSSRYPTRKVVYQKYENQNVFNNAVISTTRIENVRFYHKDKEYLHRENGPCSIHKKNYISKDKSTIIYDVEWRKNGVLHRENGPAAYQCTINVDGEISKMTLRWYVNNKKWRTLHRMGGPAHHILSHDGGINKLIYAIDGIKSSEYDYWLTMYKQHPYYMPKVSVENDIKISFEYNPNKPSPSFIYKNTKKLIWNLHENDTIRRVPSYEYWKKIHMEFAEKKNWLVMK